MVGQETTTNNPRGNADVTFIAPHDNTQRPSDRQATGTPVPRPMGAPKPNAGMMKPHGKFDTTKREYKPRPYRSHNNDHSDNRDSYHRSYGDNNRNNEGRGDNRYQNNDAGHRSYHKGARHGVSSRFNKGNKNGRGKFNKYGKRTKFRKGKFKKRSRKPMKMYNETNNTVFHDKQMINLRTGNKVVKWRVKSTMYRDFHGKEIKGKFLSHVDMRWSNITNCVFDDCRITQARFRNVQADNVTFKDCDLTSTTFALSSLNNATFLRSRCVGVDFRKCDFTGSTWTDCNMSRGYIHTGGTIPNFTECTFNDCFFRDNKQFADYLHDDTLEAGKGITMNDCDTIGSGIWWGDVRPGRIESATNVKMGNNNPKAWHYLYTGKAGVKHSVHITVLDPEFDIENGFDDKTMAKLHSLSVYWAHGLSDEPQWRTPNDVIQAVLKYLNENYKDTVLNGERIKMGMKHFMKFVDFRKGIWKLTPIKASMKSIQEEDLKLWLGLK